MTKRILFASNNRGKYDELASYFEDERNWTGIL